MHAVVLERNYKEDDGSTSEDSDDDDDATIAMTLIDMMEMETQTQDGNELSLSPSPSPPTNLKNPYLGGFMKNGGHLCNSVQDDIVAHGLLGPHAQDLWVSFNHVEMDEQRRCFYVANRLIEYLKTLSLDAQKLAEMHNKNREDIEITCATANLGYQIMALGLWAALHGPYDNTQVLENMIVVAKGARGAPIEAMGHWIFALSLGLECEDLREHHAWKVLTTAVPPVIQAVAASQEAAT